MKSRQYEMNCRVGHFKSFNMEDAYGTTCQQAHDDAENRLIDHFVCDPISLKIKQF